MNGGGRCFETNCDFGRGPDGLPVSEDGVEEPDFEGTGGGGGEGFDSHCLEAESWFTVFLVGGVLVIESSWFGFVAVEGAGVASSKSSKPQASPVVLSTGDTINELEPLDFWRIGCWLVEGVIRFNEPNESICADEERVLLCWVPFAAGGC